MFIFFPVRGIELGYQPPACGAPVMAPAPVLLSLKLDFFICIL